MNWLNITCLILTYCVTIIKAKSTTIKAKQDNVTDYGLTVWCKMQANGFSCLDRERSTRFYYDVKLKGCKTAEFGECMYRDLNSFSTIKACTEACRDEGEHPITSNISAKVYCRLQPDFGDCDEYHPMYYYDLTFRQCRGFSYSGCGGNRNRFPSRAICSSTCLPIVEYN